MYWHLCLGLSLSLSLGDMVNLRNLGMNLRLLHVLDLGHVAIGLVGWLVHPVRVAGILGLRHHVHLVRSQVRSMSLSVDILVMTRQLVQRNRRRRGKVVPSVRVLEIRRNGHLEIWSRSSPSSSGPSSSRGPSGSSSSGARGTRGTATGVVSVCLTIDSTVMVAILVGTSLRRMGHQKPVLRLRGRRQRIGRVVRRSHRLRPGHSLGRVIKHG